METITTDNRAHDREQNHPHEANMNKLTTTVGKQIEVNTEGDRMAGKQDVTHQDNHRKASCIKTLKMHESGIFKLKR